MSGVTIPGTMVSIDALLDRLRELDIRVWLEGEQLRVSAPAGVITPEIREELRARRGELRLALGARASARRGEASGPALSIQQERLWFFQALEPESSTYNVPVVLTLAGPLDESALARAITTMVERQESLRTVIREVDGEPHAELLLASTVQLLIEDVSRAPTGEREALAEAVWKRDGERPFDLTKDVPCRVTLVRLASEVHHLVVTFHHVAADGGSIPVFVGELTECYRAFAEGAAPRLPPLTISFADYARQQRQWLESPKASEALAYWTQRLGGQRPVLDLPTDHPRPAVQTFRGSLKRRMLSREIAEGLRALSQRHGCTLFMTMLAVFDTVLYRHGGEDDVIVGAPMAKRDSAETQHLVGMFVDTLVLRSDLAGNPTFGELLGRVRATCLAAFAHQDLPFGRLVDALHPERDLSRTPLFQVMFNMFPFDVSDVIRVAGLEVRTPSGERLLAAYDGQSKFDLTLYSQLRPNGIELLLSYNADLFDGPRMDRLLADVELVVDAVLRDPSERIGDIRLTGTHGSDLPRANHAMRRGAFTPLAPEFVNGSIVGRFRESAARHAVRAAVVDESRTWTYSELERQAAAIARLVADAAGEKPTRVALLCEHAAPMVAAILGVLIAGSAYVPLDPTAPEARLALLVDDADATVILVDPAYAALAERIAGSRRVIRTDGPAPAQATFDADVSGESLAYILYTSGSTGRPKGVRQSQRNVLHYVRGYTNAVEITPDDRMTLVASYTFDAAVVDIFSALLNGATLYPVSVRVTGLQGVAGVIRERAITIYHSTPTLYRSIVPYVDADSVATVRCVVMGGEKVQPRDLTAFRELFSAPSVFVNLYGASEATIATMALFSGNELPAGSVVPIGHAIEDTSLVFVEPSGRVAPVRGEMVVRSPYVALGYWRADELTERAFAEDESAAGLRQYRTGDVGRRLPDGAIEHLGRRDEQIKIRGVRIEPGEIEVALSLHPNVAACAVVADRTGADPVLLAFVVLDPAASATSAELGEFLAAVLPEYMLPAAITSLDALPLTRTGKVDRRALPTARALGLAERDEYVAPRDAMEQLVADVWAEVLRVPRIGIHDNFFALGGHSLNATQVLARLRELAGVDLPLRGLFLSPTIEALARSVREARSEPGENEPPLCMVPHDGPSPLSYSQERMWLVQQLMPEGRAYNMTAGIEFTGPFDREDFLAAFADAVARQESLRTIFEAPTGEPRQRIVDTLELPLVEHDVRPLAADEREPAARRIAAELALASFDLERGPLWRLLLMRLDDERTVVVVVAHHIIGDLWSFGVLGQELSRSYNARRRNAAMALPPVSLRYRDFAVWQRQWMAGSRLEEQLAFWTTTLGGVPPLELPLDRPRPAFMTTNGSRRVIELPAPLVERVRTMSLREHATPFMTLFAAFNVLLHRYSGQDDVAVGVPIANRTRVGTEGLVGTFVNTLVHRNDLSGTPTFRELLRRVRAVALDVYTHQDLPFERLVRELAPDRDPSRSPIFQVLFNLANAPADPGEFADLTYRQFLVDRAAAQFDLTVSVNVGDPSAVAMSYNTDLFDAATIDRLIANYIVLLDAATRQPDARIDGLPVMPRDAEHSLLVEQNATEASYPAAAVTALVAEQAAKSPDRVAVEFGSTTLTYGMLEARSNRLARYLGRRGVSPGSLVGVYLARSPELVVSLLAILKAGAGYVPIDPNYPANRVQFMLEDSGAAAVITEQLLADKLPVSATSCVVLERDAAAVAAESDAALERTPAPSDRAYVIYTSGSTGTPKGVQISHGALVNFLWSMRRAPGMCESDALLAVTTISFDIAGLELYLPLVCGATIVLAPRQVAADGRALHQLLTRRRPTVMQATPATWRSLIDAGWSPGETPDLSVLCGGEALPRDLADALLERGREVWNLYGPTETTIWSTAHRVERATGPVPIGRPIANTRVYVLDAQQRPVPVGAAGELYIGGDGVAIGYLDRPELTASRFVADPFGPRGARMYRTGDRVRMRSDWSLEHLGRFDDQVKVRGYRIELGEVEAAVAKLPAVARCVVDVRQERLVAYVVFAGIEELTASEIRAFLRDTLPDFMVPSLVVPLDALPLTPNGKIDRRALPDPLRAGRSAAKFQAPATPTETLIARVWANALGLERVSATDNFFEIGGHSLLSMRVVHEIHQLTGWRPDPRLLFFETLAGIAATRPGAASPSSVAGSVA